jgi:hypothetical protein
MRGFPKRFGAQLLLNGTARPAPVFASMPAAAIAEDLAPVPEQVSACDVAVMSKQAAIDATREIIVTARWVNVISPPSADPSARFEVVSADTAALHSPATETARSEVSHRHLLKGS